MSFCLPSFPPYLFPAGRSASCTFDVDCSDSCVSVFHPPSSVFLPACLPGVVVPVSTFCCACLWSLDSFSMRSRVPVFFPARTALSSFRFPFCDTAAFFCPFRREGVHWRVEIVCSVWVWGLFWDGGALVCIFPSALLAWGLAPPLDFH
eukprot:RCo039502